MRPLSGEGGNVDIRARVVFHGRVQGVWFRASTRDVAKGIGVKGWVRNLPDGTVEAVFEGRKDKVEKAIAECRQFPPPKRVDHVDVEFSEPRNEFTTFEVRY